MTCLPGRDVSTGAPTTPSHGVGWGRGAPSLSLVADRQQSKFPSLSWSHSKSMGGRGSTSNGHVDDPFNVPVFSPALLGAIRPGQGTFAPIRRVSTAFAEIRSLRRARDDD
jgi:hypothetical protein